MDLNELVKSARFTILLGKNGVGKSTLLRALDSSDAFRTKYISPERGGSLTYDPHIDSRMSTNDTWVISDRRRNRTEMFRQQSAAHFRNLELLVLREIEQHVMKGIAPPPLFDDLLSQINTLLPMIELIRSDNGFKIRSKGGEAIPEDKVSSGEAELITISIEVLVFSREVTINNVLLLDEPDVHLHPDLQERLVEFIKSLAIKADFKVVIATHSTAIIGALSRNSDCQIVPITDPSQTTFLSFKCDPICEQILPIFGAHPLSAQFNRLPVLLVEGEDDKRVVEQLVRSSEGKYLFTPCVVKTVDAMNEWEKWLNEFLPSIYDKPIGFSLRDLDDSEQCHMDDVGCVRRARFNCRTMENLLLTDECLNTYRHTSSSFEARIGKWIAEWPAHSATPAMKDLFEAFDDRRTARIKDVANILVALLDTRKPWEVVVGQLLANHAKSVSASKHSIREYLGPGVVDKLFSSP